MVKAKGTLLALILLFLAGPAFAAVDRFTDEKGVIHITNGKAPKPPVQENQAEPAPAPVEPPPAEAPEAPPSQEAAPPSLPENRNGAGKPNSYLTVRKGVIHITNVADRNETLARRPQAPDFKEIPCNVPSSGLRPAIAPVAWAGTPAPAITPHPASVRTYKDRRGVIHITNLPTGLGPRNLMVAGWSSIAAGPECAGSGQNRTPWAFPEFNARTPALAVQKVSLADLAPAFDLAPAASAAETATRRAGPKIRRFRDGKGVLHLVGRGPAPNRQPDPVETRIAAAPPGPLPAAGDPRFRQGSRSNGLPHPTVSVRRDKQGRLLIRSAPAEPATHSPQEEPPPQIAPVVAEAALLYGLPVSLIEAVIKVESNFQPRAVSPKGAMGLMQLMPGTARFLQVSDPFCPRENVLAGCRYLRLLLDFFGKSLPLALAAYNAGYQRVLEAGLRVPDIEETRNFVTQVLARYYLREKQRQYRSSML